jgi:trimeric autotransporter adhesin
MKLQQLTYILIGIVCIGFLPKADSVVPPPDGGYSSGNTAEGQNALFSLTSGGYNTAVGFFSLRSNTTASFNTGVGAGTLLSNRGDNNTATGAVALLSNTTGRFNTANGVSALLLNTTGDNNTAVGFRALASNTVGNFNTAAGVNALLSNTTGGGNTAIGDEALLYNTTGADNTATGFGALTDNTTGDSNTAIGPQSLYSNTEGSSNTAIGPQALSSNTTGSENTTIGYQALTFNTAGFSNTAIGIYALGSSTGNSNTALGQRAGDAITTANNVICIGAPGVNVSNSCYIGGIAGQTVGLGGSTCYVDNDGKLGVFLSARRFKTDIADMDHASEALLALRPVTFHYKPELDKTGIPQFGLIAEEVEAANPDLVVRDKQGKVTTVRYEAVNAMLLNEFLKEHRKVQEQEASITQLKKCFGTTIAQLTARLDEQAAQIQKVTAQLAAASPSGGRVEVSQFSRGGIGGGGPAPEVVNNP